MKRSLWWISVSLPLTFAVSGLMLSGCAAKKLSDEEAYQRFVGRWVNTEYPGTLELSQVTVIRPDYVGEDWLLPDSKEPAGQWTIRVHKTWVDKQGYTYCQSWATRTQPESMRGSVAFLMRVNKERKIWESCFSSGNSMEPPTEDAAYPERIDKTGFYFIYYRQ
jgi:hypothetical protein